MGADKKGSKSGGGYVGGFLQLFDWNAKSRKKLFSSKSDLPDQYKQKKRSDGNFPSTQVHMMEEDETATRSIFNGSSDYSCASSVTDEDPYGTKAPGVVAKLMGLDCLPTYNYAESDSTAFSDTQSLRDFRYHSGNLESHHDRITFSGNLCEKLEAPGRTMIEQKQQKPMIRPIEKFQSEVLPPKSAKSIPITQHKLLSPIKRSNFIPSKDGAHIMEAAARIPERGPQVTAKAKISTGGSSSAPLRLRDLKEKVEAAQKGSRLADPYRRQGESSAAKYLKGQAMNKSWNGSADASSVRTSSDSEECSVSRKNKGKSISLALQAKVNVQKREGLNSSGSRNVVAQKESSEVRSKELFKTGPSTQKHKQKKSSAQGVSTVLRQNNQKQNRLADTGNLPSKPSKPSKPYAPNSQVRKVSADSSFARQKSSIKTAGNCEAGSRRLGSDGTNDKRESSYSSAKNLTRKKRCIEGEFQNSAVDNMSIDRSEKLIRSDSIKSKQITWPEQRKRNSTDIVSFTFSAPMTRSSPDAETSREMRGFGSDYRSKRALLSSDDLDNSNKSAFPKRVLGGDALSTLLEQKLRELTCAVEASQQKAETAGTSASIFPRSQDVMQTENLVNQWGAGSSSGFMMPHKHNEMEGVTYYYNSNDTTAKGLIDCRLPSPISVLDTSLFMESCNSSDTTQSNSTGVTKPCSFAQAQEMFGTTSLKRLHPVDVDMDLSDSAASTYTRTVAGEKSSKWELEYVKEILSNVEFMFKDFAMGRAREIINPHLFDQLESRKGVSLGQGHEHKLRRKALFDCVSECIDLRCKRYVGGGCRAWAKGLSVVRRKERLAQEVYNEISCWSRMGDSMVDELVDKDMSSQYGRWIDFESEAFEMGLLIENRLLNSLIDEVVADMLVL